MLFSSTCLSFAYIYQPWNLPSIATLNPVGPEFAAQCDVYARAGLLTLEYTLCAERCAIVEALSSPSVSVTAALMANLTRIGEAY